MDYKYNVTRYHFKLDGGSVPEIVITGMTHSAQVMYAEDYVSTRSLIRAMESANWFEGSVSSDNILLKGKKIVYDPSAMEQTVDTFDAVGFIKVVPLSVFTQGYCLIWEDQEGA